MMVIQVESEARDDMHGVGFDPMIKFLFAVEILDLEDHAAMTPDVRDATSRMKILEASGKPGYSWICK